MVRNTLLIYKRYSEGDKFNMKHNKPYILPNSCNSCNRKHDCEENLDLSAMKCKMREGHRNVRLEITPDEVTGRQFPSAYQSDGIIS